MVTPIPFEQLQAGDFVHDMHDPLAELARVFAIRAMYQWHTAAGHGSARLKSFDGLANKELRVLGGCTGLEHEGEIVCGYNYDMVFSGIIVIGQKEDA